MDESLLQRYISQQSAVWKALLDKRESLTAPFAVLEPKPDRVILIGSGSSHYAALMARPVLEQAFGVEVSCFVPSQEEQLIRCRAAHPLYIAVSQSGISTNTYTLIRSLRAQGYPVVALTEHLDSPVGKAASLAIPLLIGEERIGAKTKGVTATVLTLMLLGLSVCCDESYRTRLYAALDALIIQSAENLRRAQIWSRAHLEEVIPFRHLYVIAGNDGLGAAQEAALKLLETNYLPVSCYPLDEYIHGIQNALDGDACLICLLPPETHTERTRMLTLTAFARSVGAQCFLIAPGGAENDLTALNLLDTECRELRCLTYLPAAQTLAAVLSAARGIDTSRRRYPDFFARMGSKME